jgi:hypothetical protein
MPLTINFCAARPPKGNEAIEEISQITVKENELSSHIAKDLFFSYIYKEVRRHSSVNYWHHIWYKK